MQDIDFDEIDRAVTSASGTTAPVVDGPVSVSTAPLANEPVRDTTPAVAPAARRSSGRFMDVVHPSSDMRSSSPVPARPVQPVETPVAATAPVEEPAQTAAWPDPLDFHGFVDEEAVKPVEDAKPARIIAPSADDMHPPLETPFIQNAVVEKRPLGAFSEASPAPTVPEPIIPEEIVAEPIVEETPQETPDLTEEVSPVEEAPASAPVIDAPAGPVSITQQYKEQPSTTDQPSGAIFDTESYHQPLVHVPKKKSGILVVIWIAALILVGAGAGAAVYFFVLPLL